MSQDSLLVAVDIDPLMVQHCGDQVAEKFPQHKVKVMVQDFAQPFEMLRSEITSLEGQVDLIISNYALHWISLKQRSNAVSSVQKLLLPGGQALINEFLKANHSGSCESVEEVQNVLNIQSYEAEEKMWKSEFGKVEFSQVQVSVYPLDWTFKTREEFLFFMKMWRVYQGENKEGYSVESTSLTNIPKLIEKLDIRFHTGCHVKAVREPGNPEDLKTGYYHCVRIAATK